MTEQLKRLIAAAGIATVCVTGLAACGHSDDDGLTDMQRQDRDASASISGLFNFGQTLINSMTVETNEPRAIGGITPPVSEAAEPSPLI